MRDVSHIARTCLLAVAAAALASLCLSGLGSAASRANGLTINVTYTATSLSAKLSNGTVLTSGTVVPPGAPNPQFTITGPGAAVSSDLNPTGQGIEVPVTFGKPVLTQEGKPVKTLKAGKYSVVVGDLSTTAGLMIGHGKAKPTTLSGAAATGTSSRTLKLTAGKWFIEGSTKGPKIYFTVT